MARYGMVIDLKKCVGCQACVAACKETWDAPPGQSRDWVYEYEGRDASGQQILTYYPGLCNHCDITPCVDACPTHATFKDEHGIVVIDPDVCIGCGYCISACPYNARYHDDRRNIADKCNYCKPRLASGGQPACVTTCLGHCRYFGDMDDPGSDPRRVMAAKETGVLVSAAVSIGPNTRYVGERERALIMAHGVPGSYALVPAGNFWKRIIDPVGKALLLLSGAGMIGLLAITQLRSRFGKHSAAASAAEGEHDVGARD